MSGGFDHIVLCVNDLEQAADFYRRLGFTTTPRAQHTWGTDNILVQLDGCFLELLTVSRPELIQKPDGQFSFGAFNQLFLERRQGMSMLVFETSDAEAEKQRLDNAGITPNDNFHFKRNAKLPSGDVVEVAFTLAFAINPKTPNAAFFYCQQHAPEYFWKSEYQKHENTAQTICSVTMIDKDLESSNKFFSSTLGESAKASNKEKLIFNTPRGFIDVLRSESSSENGFAGFSIGVSDLEKTRKILDRNTVPYTQTNNALSIAAEEAFGVKLTFVGLKSDVSS